MNQLTQFRSPFDYLRNVAGACILSALATAAAAVVAIIPSISGSEGMIQSLISIFILVFAVAIPASLQASLATVTAVVTMRRRNAAFLARPLGSWLFLVGVASAVSILVSLVIAWLIGMPIFNRSANALDLTAVIVLCEAVGGVVLGTRLARKLGLGSAIRRPPGGTGA
ncbi:MAG TPA: hypothetical protein VHI13_08460 [Candidatus Kapabacteria bacterium]|nr:hypothetical protein [Candidatus Kapabacteria bacterium]